MILFIMIRRFPDTAQVLEENGGQAGKIKQEIDKSEPIEEMPVGSRYSESVKSCLREAKELIDDNKAQQAEDKLIEAIQEDLHCATAYTLLGDIYFQRKRTEEAEESYKAALKSDDSQAAAHFGLALILEEQGRSNEAVKEAQQAVKLDSSNDLWYKKLADFYMDLRMYAKAEMAYRKAEILRPDYAHYKELATAAGEKQLSHKVGR